jgi:hypothetical protein
MRKYQTHITYKCQQETILMIVDRRFRGLMMEAVRTSETSVDNHFTRQYIPEDNSERKMQISDKNSVYLV